RLGAIISAAIVIVLGVVHLVSFDDRARTFEKAITAVTAQPAKIGSLHFGIFPRPHWRAEQVAIGDKQQIQAERIDIGIGLAGVFSEKPALGRIDVVAPKIDEAAAGWMLFNANWHVGSQIGPLYLSGARLVSSALDLGELEGHASFDEQ